jgi:Antitoxin Xre-like helix-turn-helix domain/Antitoxin Xre/MbcA/ParS C-terminal toxin-binding domain
MEHCKEASVATVNQLDAGIAWEKPANLSSKDVQKRLGPSAVKAFLKIRDLWELRDEDARQLLGGISNGAFYELKRKARGTLDQDRLTRISILTGIFKGLNILYSKKLADRWIQLPNENPMFEGETPLTYMIKGGLPSMVRVRQLLDSRRGGR